MTPTDPASAAPDLATARPPEHVHEQRYDGDDPYLICHGCGQRWDAITGQPIGTTTGLTLRPDRPLYPTDPELARLRAIETAARAFVAAEKAWTDARLDPALGSVADEAAAALRAALEGSKP